MFWLRNLQKSGSVKLAKLRFESCLGSQTTVVESIDFIASNDDSARRGFELVRRLRWFRQSLGFSNSPPVRLIRLVGRLECGTSAIAMDGFPIECAGRCYADSIVQEIKVGIQTSEP